MELHCSISVVVVDFWGLLMVGSDRETAESRGLVWKTHLFSESLSSNKVEVHNITQVRKNGK